MLFVLLLAGCASERPYEQPDPYCPSGYVAVCYGFCGRSQTVVYKDWVCEPEHSTIF